MSVSLLLMFVAFVLMSVSLLPMFVAFVLIASAFNLLRASSAASAPVNVAVASK